MSTAKKKVAAKKKAAPAKKKTAPAKKKGEVTSLEAYRQKRDFTKTREPPPKRVSTETGRSFVIQQHAARRMHWDFRLELDGVLLSWAVPKGPSLDPRERRLAVRTEDHPVEYGSFEGTIPKGEYGGGTVLLWDQGTWEPEGDPHAGLEKGHLRFTLEGKRLHGRWNLVQTKGGWLLIKGKDEHARPGDADRVVREAETSVASGRTMSAIGKDPDRVWSSTDAPEPPDPGSLEGAVKRAFPSTMTPELATLVYDPPEGDDWLHEIKLDGYRILARLDNEEACLFTRKGNDWTGQLGSVARALSTLPVERAWLDGEIVVYDRRGRSDFGALQDALAKKKDDPIRYVVFDLLYLDGYDLRGVALSSRKELLRALLARGAALEGRLRFSEHVKGEGPRFFEEACRLELEGIVSKRASCPYVGRRTKDWRKVKCAQRTSATIVGFSEPSGSRSGLGALLLAQEGRYVGKVGTGFDERTLRDLRARLEPLEIPRPKVEGTPRTMRKVHWVEPKLVAEVTFAERTRDGKLRHPVFVGLEKNPSTRAEPAPKKAAKKAGKKGGGATVAGVRLSNPEKVFFPGLGVTKRELATYYETIEAYAVPQVAGRPLTLLRCPEGVGSCFYMQHAFPGMPRAIHRVRVREREGALDHVYVRDLAGLVTLAQFAALEIHTWSSRVPKIEKADQLVFDLDPGPGIDWDHIAVGAFAVRDRLAELGLTSFVKTSGGKGLHVLVPIVPELPWATTKAFTHAVASDLARRDPARFTATITKSKRTGKIYVDYVRNTRGATAVAAYSTRAKPEAPVSTPITWDELEAGVDPASFDVRTIPARLGKLERDPWEGFFTSEQHLTRAMLDELGVKTTKKKA